MGSENCEVGFGKKNELGNGIGTLPSGPLSEDHGFFNLLQPR